MSDYLNIAEFLLPLHRLEISADEGYKDGQIGKSIEIYEDEFPDLTAVDIVILGCPESRGGQWPAEEISSVDKIRQAFYELYLWHTDLRIADIGNIQQGAGLSDTYAALKVVLKELKSSGKKAIILGGTHDLALAQYHSFADLRQVVEIATVDALIDINIDSPKRSEQFLMEMLTDEPNYISHYNHIGFQSYYVHPRMLETMDKLRFDCFRVGVVRDSIEEMEPVIRNSAFLSFDISAIAHAYAPANHLSPNGLTGEEACLLMRYSGLSSQLASAGIYGYRASDDQHSLTAKQVAQMIWYYLDGYHRGRREAELPERDHFNEYHTAFAEVETTFLQSKKTGRWWMQLPGNRYIACSYKDYLLASSNEVPERWLRAQERN